MQRLVQCNGDGSDHQPSLHHQDLLLTRSRDYLRLAESNSELAQSISSQRQDANTQLTSVQRVDPDAIKHPAKGATEDSERQEALKKHNEMLYACAKDFVLVGRYLFAHIFERCAPRCDVS